MTRTAAAASAVVAVLAAVALALGSMGRDEHSRCGRGFHSRGTRCMPGGAAEGRDRAADAHDGAVGCAPPLAWTGDRCDAPDVRVVVPEVTFTMGPSDWEAEGIVADRAVRVAAFRIDAFEVTRGAWGATAAHLLSSSPSAATGGTDLPSRADSSTPAPSKADAALAISGVTRDAALAFCARRGGRLPTEEEWIAAAGVAGSATAAERARDGFPTAIRRYPWGDTGAVCRRGAWGLATGPCARGGTGPDTVGAHPDGDTPLGLHDMAGNVAEWIAPAAPDGPEGAGAAAGIAKGGSWENALASELRVWARLEIDPRSSDPRVGFRCAYPP